MRIDGAWTTIDGNSWKIRVGEHAALVWLHKDEKTYLTNVFLGDGNLKFPGQFDCLKKAKAACLKAIADTQHAADTTEVTDEEDEVAIGPGPSEAAPNLFSDLVWGEDGSVTAKHRKV